MAKKSGGNAKPFITKGLIETSVAGLKNDAGFGQPGLEKFRTDIDNEVGEDTIPFTRPDGAKESGPLKDFLRKG